jgi:O-antigen/teichoic acid export membrane protein
VVTKQRVSGGSAPPGDRRVGVAALSRLVGALTTAVAGLTTTALLLRMLGHGGYGRLAFGLSAVVLLAVLAQLGLGTAAMQRIAAFDEVGDVAGVLAVARGAISVILVTSAAAGVVVIVVMISLSELPSADAVVVGAGLSLLLLGTNAAIAAGFIARGLSRFFLSEVAPVAVVLMQLAFVVLLRALSLSTERDVAVAYGLVGLLSIGVSVAIVRGLLPASVFAVQRRAALDVIRIAIPFAVAGLALQAIAQADVFALGLVRPPAELGRYEPTIRVMDRVMLLVPMLLLAGFVPLASRLWARRDEDGFRGLFVSASKAGFVFAMPAIVLIAAFPASLPRALFGSSFPVSTMVVRTLLVGYVVNLAFGLNSGALVAMGDAARLRRPYIWTFVVMVVLAAALTPAFGAEGAAVATSASYLFLNVAVTVTLHAATRVHLVERDYVLVAGSGLALAAVAAVVAPSGTGIVPAIGIAFAVWGGWVALIAGMGWFSRADVAALVPIRGGGR